MICTQWAIVSSVDVFGVAVNVASGFAVPFRDDGGGRVAAHLHPIDHTRLKPGRGRTPRGAGAVVAGTTGGSTKCGIGEVRGRDRRPRLERHEVGDLERRRDWPWPV